MRNAHIVKKIRESDFTTWEVNISRRLKVTIIVCDTKMHQCGVEVHYFWQLLFSSTSNFDDSVNYDNLLVREIGEVSEAMDFDTEMTRLVAVGETG
jgi:hypothetical protein